MRRSFLHRLVRQPVTAVALAFLGLVILACVAAPLVAPSDPLQQDLGHVFALPSGAHLLGTDGLGRDVLSRLMYGGRVTLRGAAEALAVFLVLGAPAGLLAGYHRGWFDAVATRVSEVMLSIPVIIFLLVVVAVFPANQLATMVTLGALGAPGLFRVVRGSSLAVSQELYVRAARTTGLTSGQIVRRHVAPALAGPIIVQASLFAAAAVLTESGLAFLGFSVQPPAPSWGGMVADASAVIDAHPWLLVPPGAVIALVVLALGLVGDGARDAAAGHRPSVAPAPRRRSPRRTRSTGPGEDPSPGMLLSVRGLTVTVPSPTGPLTVVSGVDLDVRPGEVLGIVGESGCGKTMVARALLGLLPDGGEMLTGRILFDGRDLAALTPREWRSVRGGAIALVPQEPVATLDPVFTVGQQVAEVVRRHCGGGRAAARRRALELLELVNLPDPEALLRRYPHELSGGMAQRVAIALALAGEPQLLLADEPTTALDVTVQAEILALLRDLQHQLNMAVVLITHDWGVLADVCDSAIVMYAGQVVEAAAVQQVFDHPLHPYTRGLIASDPVFAAPGEPLPSIPGQVPHPAQWPNGCRFAPRCALATEECLAASVPLSEPEGHHASRCVHVDELVAT